MRYEMCTDENIIKLIMKIDEYYYLPAGWDNETNKKTCEECLDKAEFFINEYLFNEDILLPEESIGTGEEVALFWKYDGFYMIIHFYPDKCKVYKDRGGSTINWSANYSKYNMEMVAMILPTLEVR